ncbi:MAG: tetratricopeptide repeat protein [Treponema sp.]|nr:tetratricopeptide repeat protein [Treponema sp.]
MKKFLSVLLITLIFLCSSCKKQNSSAHSVLESQDQLKSLLNGGNLTSEQKYAIVNQMAENLLQMKDYQGTILFLNNWVEENPEDKYNSYWLLMTAYSYLSLNAEPVAEYYFDRILRQYGDLLVKGKSIHFICLQNLIQISKTPKNRIKYFNELINRFPNDINKTELYMRLASEYEKDSQWDMALRTCQLFISQPDASTIQISGEPDAYKNARHLIDFNSSSKDWTFETLSELETAVKKAIRNYDWRSLDKYRSQVNFFSMSWRGDETAANSQTEFSMHNYMLGNRIRYADELDESSNENEAYLRTSGWNTYINVWYLYFRKVNFPLDPDINGNWEWAGIYFGNKL